MTKTIKIDARGRIRSLIFMPDGKYLLSGGDEAVIRQWRVDDGVEVGEGMKTGSKVTLMDLSGDGKWIVSGGERVADVWSAKSRQIVFKVTEHSDWVDAVHVSPDSTRFATGSNDKTAFIWNILTGRRLLGPLRHGDRVGAVKFSADGDRLATSTANNCLRIYDSRSGELLRTIPFSIASYPNPVTWTSFRSVFAIVSQTTLVHIDMNQGQTLSSWTIPGEPAHNWGPIAWGSIVLSHNGKFIISFLNNFVTFWDTSTSARISSDIRCPANLWSIALSQDSRYIAMGDVDSRITIRSVADIISGCYLVNQNVVRQPQVHLEHDLQTQIEILQGKLGALERRFDGLSRTTKRHDDPARAGPTAPLPDSVSARTEMSKLSCLIEELPPHFLDISDGIYRIKSRTNGLYLTQDGSGSSAVVMRHSDESNVCQRWTVSLLADGAYNIMCCLDNDSDFFLSVGDVNALVCVPGSGHTTWTIEPRGDTFVIGNSENATAIHVIEFGKGVCVSVRNNSQDQRWILERVGS